MENYNDFNELEEMRQQIKALKEKVERNGVLNERLVRKSVQDKMKSIHITIYKLSAMVLIAIPLWVFIKYQHNLSWYYTIFTILMMLVSVFFDWYINRIDVSKMGDDMKKTANELLKMKKQRALQEKIALLLVVPLWLVWTVFEFRSSITDPVMANGLLIGMIIGVIIGMIVGLSIYFKMQRKNTEMLEEIESITEEE
ncbi:MAG: hypothetical protein J5510_06900 [Prevotella sp.]|nr:hypothetical protein [Prevotella sp.]